jgi:hypothetical protein
MFEEKRKMLVNLERCYSNQWNTPAEYKPIDNQSKIQKKIIEIFKSFIRTTESLFLWKWNVRISNLICNKGYMNFRPELSSRSKIRGLFSLGRKSWRTLGPVQKLLVPKFWPPIRASKKFLMEKHYAILLSIILNKSKNPLLFSIRPFVSYVSTINDRIRSLVFLMYNTQKQP